jgi:hypothetical protein
LRRIGEQPGTINHALTTFLDSGDWSAASRHLPSFALNETQSEFGLLGVVLEGPVLRVLAHNGIHCCESGDHDPYESRLKQYEECGYFDLEHPKNLLGDIIQKAKTVVSINPFGPHHSQRVPAGHPLFRSFLGVPIFKLGNRRRNRSGQPPQWLYRRGSTVPRNNFSNRRRFI